MKALVFGANGQDGPLSDRGAARPRRRSGGRLALGRLGAVATSPRRDDVEAVVARACARDYIFQLAARSTTRHEALFENHGIDLHGRAQRPRVRAPARAGRAGLHRRVGRCSSATTAQPIDEETPFEASSPYAVARIQSVYAARYFRSLGLRRPTSATCSTTTARAAAPRHCRADHRPGGPPHRRRQRRDAGAGRYDGRQGVDLRRRRGARDADAGRPGRRHRGRRSARARDTPSRSGRSAVSRGRPRVARPRARGAERPRRIPVGWSRGRRGSRRSAGARRSASGGWPR